MRLRLLALAVLAFVLTLGSGSAPDVSASDVAPERCAHGAISAIGPVDEAGNGDTTPDVACREAP